jgi:formylglycine-generating enzyme required for sulfatase activity
MPSHMWASVVAVIVSALGAGSVVADDKPLKPGEVREFEIAAGVKMKFCWIPPGEAQLGSQKAERETVLKLESWSNESKLLTSEAEELRGRFTSKGYWLAKYTVMQSEWQIVMGTNPSYFSTTSDGKEKVRGLDTGRFPVEQISWDDCNTFLDKLNQRMGAGTAFGRRGKFVLPHEDEWEFACRGGRGNGRAFNYGGSLNGTQANCDGKYRYGTEAKGPFKGHTVEVGTYESIVPHPWGLSDMHGNVWQWCENWLDSEREFRVIRGGCWSSSGWNCRAAHRNGSGTDWRKPDCGIRVCFRLD